MGKNPIHAFGTTESSVGKVKERFIHVDFAGKI
jgi:hypothetical protein